MCRYGLSYFYMRGAPAETLQRYKRLYDIQVLLAWPTEYLAAGTAVSSAETSRPLHPWSCLVPVPSTSDGKDYRARH